MTNVLQNLKGLHLPGPISMWPLAPGWYLVLLVVAVIMAFALTKFFFNWLRKRRRQWVISELQQLTLNYPKSPAENLSKMSVLVRRISLALFKREHVAGLHGEAWLRFLDQQGQTDQFTRGVGRHLLSAPYQARSKIDKEHIDIQSLCLLIENWINRVL